ncbi:isoprenylcysteine carboxylmethyltransferase family protein [Candidatus Thorarchaeota archaeon]|nr:MAG: isoprenylcysteine carboxylmethyltransferase family protein [Candidatus Thorarchaeota archaeon]
MEEIIYKTSLAILIIAFFIVRAPSVSKSAKTEKSEEKKPTRERFMVFLNFVGMVGVPFIYVLTPWLDIFTFPVPEVIRIFGIIFNIAGLIFLAWIHRTLGQHWSMMLNLGKEHKLITAGPYGRIRHPMYTYFYILVISTALISANIFVGIFGFVAWTLLYVVRVGDEEAMLLEEFGEDYQEYMKRTGRLLPKF